jgi:glycosyltransferase involved in cell wall biosynthesis
VTDLAVIGQDPRFGGGAWASMAAFWEAVVALGREPRLFYLEHPSLAGRPRCAPLDAQGLHPPFRRLDALNQLWAAQRLAAAAAQARSTWVVATTAQYGAAASRSGRPYSCWVGTTLDDEWRPQLHALPRSRRLARAVNGPTLRTLERQVLARADSVYATSPTARGAIARAAGLPAERIGIIPLPVDTAEFVPVPAKDYEAALERPTVAFVGRAHDPRKNVRLLLEAWPAILARHPQATLRLVGEPPLGRVPEGVQIAGAVHSVATELRAASVLVLPSLQEGFGIVAAEALAAGVPVVTTPSGGPEDLIRRSGGGIVVESFSSGALATEVSEVLSDPGALLLMRERGRAHVELEHSPERTRQAVADALAVADAAEPARVDGYAAADT